MRRRRPLVRRSAVAAAVGLTALACAAVALGAEIGANDDTGKYAPDGGAVFYAQMAALGLRETVITTRYLPSEPGVIQDEALLDRTIPLALAAGLRVSLAVYPYPPREVEAGLATPAGFAAQLTALAERYPDVRRYVLMNEPNQPAFLRPQFDAAGNNVSAAVAGRFLAAGYDALKAVDPDILVIGVGLSPRGNDRPTAPSNVSTSPVRFLAALGRWYRASGRLQPLMDGLSFHPYPKSALDPPERGYPWPNAGFADLDRIKQALWDAFHDTAQPTTVDGLRLFLDEVGWQVDTSALPGYTGIENVAVTDEATQAAIYGRLVRAAACDPDIGGVDIFGFYDDTPRDSGFQSALHRLDGTARAAAGAVREAIAETAAGGCRSARAPWRPAQAVVGATRPAVAVAGARVRVEVGAGEGADVVACLLPGSIPAARATAALARRTASSPGCAGAKALPLRPGRMTLPRPRGLPRATVVVRLVAEANGERGISFMRQVRWPA